ncbi:MAG: biotin--[acetyl-CoA-carboxylase] ligase [Leptolyngbyaceae cyanobacterium bins.59]|nr:biotin--[acetyl-CoA-carboxylase] ligase [Leptolyngbyaceae cyanobacterium bins.59]
MQAFDLLQFTAVWDTLRARLNSPIKPTPPTLHVFSCLPSTNDRLWELVEQGVAPGTAVLALEQQAGRGQWGRQWSSPLGGLYLSLFLTPDLPAQVAAQLTMGSAWGIAQTFRAFAIPVHIKWPNDLVIRGRKLGGILTETRLQEGRVARAVVGVGVNWKNPVPTTGITVLEATQETEIQSLEFLAAIVLWGIWTGVLHWQQRGCEAVLPSYLELLAGRGAEVEWGGQRGTLIGVTATGALRVQLLPSQQGQVSEVCLQPGTMSLGYNGRGA